MYTSTQRSPLTDIMAYICSVCKQPDPPLFVLSSQSKAPICPSDLGQYIVERGVIGTTVFPIAAIEFIELPSDLPLFEQRTATVATVTEFIARITTEETAQWSDLLVNLATIQEELIAEVVRGVEALKERLHFLHWEFTAGIFAVKTELARSLKEKLLKFSPLADVIIAASKTAREHTCFFPEDTRRLVQRLKKEVAASLLPFKSEDLLTFVTQAFRPLSVQVQTSLG